MHRRNVSWSVVLEDGNPAAVNVHKPLCDAVGKKIVELIHHMICHGTYRGGAERCHWLFVCDKTPPASPPKYLDPETKYALFQGYRSYHTVNT